MLPDPAFGPCIKLLNDFMDREANQSLKTLNITRSQCHLLMVLHRHTDHTASLKKLEGALQVSQPTIVGLVARLEAKGLITGCSDPHDRRIKLVRLTEEGLAVCLSAYQSIQLTEQRLTAALDGEESARLFALLRRICDSLR